MIHAGFLVPRATQDAATYALLYGYGAVTRYGRAFQRVLLPRVSDIAVLLPRTCRNTCGLGSSPFARHYSGNHVCFLLLPLLRCFSSRRSPPLLDVHRWTGCPIRESPDHRLFAPTRCFSQLITPFIASQSLGIPHAPLSTSLRQRIAAPLFGSVHDVNVRSRLSADVEKCSA